MNRKFRIRGAREMALAISTVLVIALVRVFLWAQAPAPSALPAFGPAVTPGRTLQVADMIAATPQIPVDIYRSPNPSQQDLATFAWLEFISVASPASPQLPQLRGNTGGCFAKSGENQSATLTWETYQHRSELFPFNATGIPQPWNSTPNYMEYTLPSNGIPKLYSPGFSNYNNLDEATQIDQNYLFFPQNPGQPQPATDAQVLFEAKVNQYEWSYVNSNYATFNINQITGAISPPVNLPVGTVEVKAAWRPLSSIPASQRYRYHTASVITYSGSDAAPTAQTTTYALIALHIIHKSPNYPAFTFATFQQVDDLQNQATSQPSGVYYVPNYGAIAYSASDPKFPVTTGTAFATGQVVQNPQLNAPLNPVAYPNGTITSLPAGNIPGTVQVTQPVATAPGVATVNQQALAAMSRVITAQQGNRDCPSPFPPPNFNNFVWQYYTLTGVQAIPSNDETSPNFYLANIVVESSVPGIQLFRGFAQLLPTAQLPNGSSNVLLNTRNLVNVVDPYTNNAMTSGGGCQGCHGVAQTRDGFDFSFLYFGAGGTGFSPDTLGISPPQFAAVRQKTKKYLK
jgi:hypothetical protein